jgi:hypothetical protein
MIGIGGELSDMIVFRDNRAFRATLNEAMRVSGVEATEPWHAHHLVPIGGPNGPFRDPRPAQEIMRRVGIPLNSVENGMVLPVKFHLWLNSDPQGREYYSIVNREFLNVTDRPSALAALQRIRLEVHRLHQRYLTETPPPHSPLSPWP